MRKKKWSVGRDARSDAKREAAVFLTAAAVFAQAETRVAACDGSIDMTAFDFGAKAELFSNRTKAELLVARPRTRRRDPIGYGRFARASDAIRFAVEELTPGLLQGTCLEVKAERFDGDEIRRLYESEKYPLVRRAASR